MAKPLSLCCADFLQVKERQLPKSLSCGKTFRGRSALRDLAMVHRWGFPGCPQPCTHLGAHGPGDLCLATAHNSLSS